MFVHVVRALEEAVSAIIQNVVHIDFVGHFHLSLRIDDDHFAGIRRGAHGARIALQVEFDQFQGKRQMNDTRSVADRHHPSIQRNVHRIAGLSFGAVDGDDAALLAHRQFQLHRIQRRAHHRPALFLLTQTHQLQLGMGECLLDDEVDPRAAVEHAGMQLRFALFEHARTLIGHLQILQRKRQIGFELAVCHMDRNDRFATCDIGVKGDDESGSFVAFARFEMHLNRALPLGHHQSDHRPALRIGDDLFRGVGNIFEHLHRQGLIPQADTLFDVVVPQPQNLQFRKKNRKLIEVLFPLFHRFDLQIGAVADDLITGLPLADVHDPFIPEISGDRRTDQNDDEGEVKKKNQPLAGPPHLKPHDVGHQVKGQKQQQHLEPAGVVNQRLGGLGAVVVFDEGRRADGKGEN